MKPRRPPILCSNKKPKRYCLYKTTSFLTTYKTWLRRWSRDAHVTGRLVSDWSKDLWSSKVSQCCEALVFRALESKPFSSQLCSALLFFAASMAAIASDVSDLWEFSWLVSLFRFSFDSFELFSFLLNKFSFSFCHFRAEMLESELMDFYISLMVIFINTGIRNFV